MARLTEYSEGMELPTIQLRSKLSWRIGVSLEVLMPLFMFLLVPIFSRIQYLSVLEQKLLASAGLN